MIPEYELLLFIILKHIIYVNHSNYVKIYLFLRFFVELLMCTQQNTFF